MACSPPTRATRTECPCRRHHTASRSVGSRSAVSRTRGTLPRERCNPPEEHHPHHRRLCRSINTDHRSRRRESRGETHAQTNVFPTFRMASIRELRRIGHDRPGRGTHADADGDIAHRGSRRQWCSDHRSPDRDGRRAAATTRDQSGLAGNRGPAQPAASGPGRESGITTIHGCRQHRQRPIWRPGCLGPRRPDARRGPACDRLARPATARATLTIRRRGLAPTRTAPA